MNEINMSAYITSALASIKIKALTCSQFRVIFVN